MPGLRSGLELSLFQSSDGHGWNWQVNRRGVYVEAGRTFSHDFEEITADGLAAFNCHLAKTGEPT